MGSSVAPEMPAASVMTLRLVVRFAGASESRLMLPENHTDPAS